MDREEFPKKVIRGPLIAGAAIIIVGLAILGGMGIDKVDKRKEGSGSLAFMEGLLKSSAGIQETLYAKDKPSSIFNGIKIGIFLRNKTKEGLSLEEVLEKERKLRLYVEDLKVTPPEYFLKEIENRGMLEHLSFMTKNSYWEAYRNSPSHMEYLKEVLSGGPLPVFDYKGPGWYPPFWAWIIIALAAQIVTFIIYLVMIDDHTPHLPSKVWHWAPWWLWLLCLPCFMVAGIVKLIIFIGKKLFSATNKTETVTSGERLKKLSGNSDNDTKNLAERLGRSIQGE
ncbi:MAG: hypothetical protein Q8R29_03195 [bacterium]|nr:hypothetical protein [bacterium]